MMGRGIVFVKADMHIREMQAFPLQSWKEGLHCYLIVVLVMAVPFVFFITIASAWTALPSE
jgi:hypothetical protein